MRTVYHAENLIDAYLVKDVLEREGIPVFIAGEYLIGGVGQLPARDLIAVMVPTSSLDRALPCVREIEAMLAESRSVSLDEKDLDPNSPLAGTGSVFA